MATGDESSTANARPEYAVGTETTMSARTNKVYPEAFSATTLAPRPGSNREARSRANIRVD